MFQIAMSPKTLNVEKLEKKFASLTKSRESILGLSTWIIRHKEFYKEIVDHWLDALSKDMNSLPMFYVANDVIQNCGRKKAPEFREAFASVLERAVSLENVKEIKAEVIRMLTLWYERSIYDAAFYKKLQDKLNDVEESESEEELDESDIITNFKLENLADSLEKMKTLEEELLVKEEFLEDIDEPVITDIDNLIVKMDSQKELRKVDKYQKLVESYLALADKVMSAQKEAMLNLKYSGIFYTAQLEDAKKVAHAYRIYGKKVKIVEKAVTEKLASLPEAPAVLEEKFPEFELNSNPEYLSPGLPVMSTVNNENSNQSSNLELSISPRMNENDSFFNINMLSEKCKSPSADSQNSLSSSTKGLNNDNKTPTVVHILNKKVEEEEGSSKVVELASTATDKRILKSPLINTASKKSDKILKSPVADTTDNQITTDSIKSEKILKIPVVAEKVRRTSTDQKSKGFATDDIAKKTSVDKVPKCVVPAVVENTFNNDNNTSIDISKSLSNSLKEKKLKNEASDKESAVKLICSAEKNEEISSTSDRPKKSSESDLQTLSDIENIDFLLEKSYNEQRTKSKASFKRKIDNLLKMKQSKTCKLSNDDTIKKNEFATDTTGTENSSSISSSSLDDGKKNSISESFTVKDENVVNNENIENEEKKTSTSEQQIENNKSDQSLEITQKSKTEDSHSSSETATSTTPASISNFPDIPTELLKNILDKHRTNLNQSSDIDSCSEMNTISCLKTENLKLSDPYKDNTNYGNNINDNNHISSDVSSVLDSENNDVKIDDLEKSVKDNENITDNNNGFSKMDAENVTKSNSAVKMTPLMENLQKLLKCFTEKGPAFEELKNSKTLKTLPTYSVKSTLKLYHVLNEHHKNDTAFNSSNMNNNSLPYLSSETVSSNNNKSSVCNYSSINAFAHSKNDNLEIMDMEVDSDDDSTK